MVLAVISEGTRQGWNPREVAFGAALERGIPLLNMLLTGTIRWDGAKAPE